MFFLLLRWTWILTAGFYHALLGFHPSSSYAVAQMLCFIQPQVIHGYEPCLLEVLVYLDQMVEVVMPSCGVDDYVVKVGGGVELMGWRTTISCWNMARALCSWNRKTWYCQCLDMVLKAVCGQEVWERGTCQRTLVRSKRKWTGPSSAFQWVERLRALANIKLGDLIKFVEVNAKVKASVWLRYYDNRAGPGTGGLWLFCLEAFKLLLHL